MQITEKEAKDEISPRLYFGHDYVINATKKILSKRKIAYKTTLKMTSNAYEKSEEEQIDNI